MIQNENQNLQKNLDNETTSSQRGVYLNGRKQIIDLLRALDPSTKKTLLRNMQVRNSSLTRDLEDHSLNFASLDLLSDHDINRLFEMLDPTLTGLALYYSSTRFQKRVLSGITKTKAQKAFSLLQQNLYDRKEQINRAQEKVLEVAIELKKRRLINFN
ncbi:hypothetical protein N9N67_05550 [Bacteriovoracaceae bacterium]|nr:hypothetical protein [Bacteriovoracaceae bacterium]